LLVHVPVPAPAVRITMIVGRVMRADGVLAVLRVLSVVLGRVVTRAGVPAGVRCERVGAVRRGGVARPGAGETAGARREVVARHGESGARFVTGAIVSLRVAALVIRRAGMPRVPIAGVVAGNGVTGLGMAGIARVAGLRTSIARVAGFMAGVAGLMTGVADVAGLMPGVAEVTGVRVTRLVTGIAGVTRLVAGIAGVARLVASIAGVAALGMADIAGVTGLMAGVTGVTRFVTGVTGLVTGVAER
jgi:hypothetical protein